MKKTMLFVLTALLIEISPAMANPTINKYVSAYTGCSTTSTYLGKSRYLIKSCGVSKRIVFSKQTRNRMAKALRNPGSNASLASICPRQAAAIQSMRRRTRAVNNSFYQTALATGPGGDIQGARLQGAQEVAYTNAAGQIVSSGILAWGMSQIKNTNDNSSTTNNYHNGGGNVETPPAGHPGGTPSLPGGAPAGYPGGTPINPGTTNPVTPGAPGGSTGGSPL